MAHTFSTVFDPGHTNMCMSKTYCKILKSKDVEDSNESLGISARISARVDLVHQPCKCPRVECFCHSMPVLTCLRGVIVKWCVELAKSLQLANLPRGISEQCQSWFPSL